MAVDIDHLRQWIGKTEEARDLIAPVPLAALAATLDRDDPHPQAGDAVPPAGHWLYFVALTRQSELAFDGHARRGGFLPPVELPRRMWAGGRIEFPGTLRVGDEVSRRAVIKSVEHKQCRSGDLVFVVVRYEIANESGVAIAEEHDIVYRADADPNAPPPPEKPAPTDAQWSRTIIPDSVLLFRYSALIFNGHKIHFDRDFTVDEEGYPGLIVHGPLIATYLMDLCRRERRHAKMTRFAYRAVSPLFDDGPFTVNGRPTDTGAQLWAANATGGLAMSADAEFET